MTLPVLIIMAMASIGLTIYALMSGKSEEHDTVARRMSGKGREREEIQEKAQQSVAAKMMEKVAPIAIKPVMPKDSAEMSKIRIKLAAAGMRKENVSTIFLASKTVLAILGGIAIAFYSWSGGNGASNILGMSLFGAALGFMAPNLWLASAIKKRGDAIRKGLPDSLDLLVITVESGLALDGALQRVGDEMRNVHPELSEEFQIATRESQMGIPRNESLDNMAERTQVSEMKSLVAIVNQAEKFGTSVGKALRHQADALRTKRRQAAEEKAQKVAVKLMAPLILFIFPAIFVVLVGPAALRMYEMSKTNSALF